MRNLKPGSPAYEIREQQREPDERIAALQQEQVTLRVQLSDYGKREHLNEQQIYHRLEEIAQKVQVLERSPDRVCRLRQLAGALPFREWLKASNKPTPTIMRFGVPVPASEQDGYYAGDYQEWLKLGSPAPKVPAAGQNPHNDKAPARPTIAGEVLHRLAIFADLVAQIREEMHVSRGALARQTGITEKAIEDFEIHEPGSLDLKALAHLLHCLDCRLELRIVRNTARPDEPFEALRPR